MRIKVTVMPGQGVDSQIIEVDVHDAGVHPHQLLDIEVDGTSVLGIDMPAVAYGDLTELTVGRFHDGVDWEPLGEVLV